MDKVKTSGVSGPTEGLGDVEPPARLPLGKSVCLFSVGLMCSVANRGSTAMCSGLTHLCEQGCTVSLRYCLFGCWGGVLFCVPF